MVFFYPGESRVNRTSFDRRTRRTMAVSGEEARRLLESFIRCLKKPDDCDECLATNAVVLIECDHHWETCTGWDRITSRIESMRDCLAAEVNMCVQTGLECYSEIQILTKDLTITRRWIHFSSEGGRIVFLRIFGERLMQSRDE